jgi:hypothetical protein
MEEEDHGVELGWATVGTMHFDFLSVLSDRLGLTEKDWMVFIAETRGMLRGETEIFERRTTS